ncbi:RpfH protein [Xanthomonas fragariae]|uniref:RpfH protein n=2 Tax=Xanthomonas fragariae TaxID=48664 RepID=A0A1Y6HJA3_9XANT|nr:RpfH protein [Xanthomonas fragariae LMG 25863]SMQ95366.1 RpfH protein [Xanthomonas fragariae]SMR03256.1 RpfH protein [Xanthomonas fragariae]
MARGQLRDQLAKRTDSEHGQASVRIAMILVIVAYSVRSASQWQVFRHQLHQLFWLIAIGKKVALLIVVWSVAMPKKLYLRRTLGMQSDYGLVALAMTRLGAPMACLSVFLLWVTIGDGLHVDRQTLHMAMAMAMAAPSVGMTLADSADCQQQLGLAIALLSALIVIPMSLLRLLSEQANAPAAPHPVGGDDAASAHGRNPSSSDATARLRRL